MSSAQERHSIAGILLFHWTCHRKKQAPGCNVPFVQFWHKPFFSNFVRVSSGCFCASVACTDSPTGPATETRHHRCSFGISHFSQTFCGVETCTSKKAKDSRKQCQKFVKQRFKVHKNAVCNSNRFYIPRTLSREGRPSSPHTAFAGAICSHSSEFCTLELLNSGLSCQQAALL